MRRSRTLIWAALLLAGCAGTAPSPDTSNYNAVDGVAAFQMSWERIRDTHFDKDQLDWDAIHAEFLPQAQAARSNAEVRGVIDDMLDRLGQSHFEIMPPAETMSSETTDRSGDPGIDVRWVQDDLLVTAVREGSSAARAGVVPGWIVEKIDGRERREGSASARGQMAAQRSAVGRTRGPVGSEIEIVFRDAEMDEIKLSLVREDRPGKRVQIAGLPEFWAHVAAESMPMDQGCVGLLQFEIWMPPIAARFPDAMKKLQDCDALVIDIRGNAGGVGALAKGLAGYLVQEPGTLGTMTSRENTIEFTTFPRPIDAKQGKQNFEGPVAILMDALSASTSEIFAVGLQETGRAKTFGTVTAGMALPSITEKLPNGDTLLHAVADFTTPLGNPLEGYGVQPDFAIELDRDTLLTGEDPIMSAALEWIQAELKNESLSEGSME